VSETYRNFSCRCSLNSCKAFDRVFPTKAVELLAVDTNEVTEISVPPENGMEDLVKFWEIHLIGDRDQADYHRTHLA